MRVEMFLAVQLLLAAVLAYSSFCRWVHTDANTYREIRWAIWFEGVAAGMVFGAPFLPKLMPNDVHWQPWTTPSWVWLTLLLAVTLVQLTTAAYWRGGKVPPEFVQRRPVAMGALAAVLLLLAGFTAAPRMAVADAPSDWTEITDEISFHQPGTEIRCNDPRGCILASPSALQELLIEAGGSCGRIPPFPKGRST